MNITFYTFVMSFILFNVLIIAIYFFRKSECFIRNYGVGVLLTMVVISFIRLFFPVEFQFTNILNSSVIYPFILDVLYFELLGLEQSYFSVNILSILIFTSISVSIILTIGSVKKYRKGCKLISQLHSTASPETTDIYHRTTNHFGIKKPPKLIQTAVFSIPQIIGIKKQYILIPDIKLTEKELIHVFKHELTHSINKDIWTRLLINGVCIFMWWNPIVRLLKKDIIQILEIKCDATVCKKMSDSKKIEYLETIVSISKKKSQKQLETFDMMQTNATLFSKSNQGDYLAQRFDALLNSTNNIRDKVFKVALITFLIVMFVLSYSVVVQPFGLPVFDDVNENGLGFDDSSSYILATGDKYQLFFEDKFLEYIDNDEYESMKKQGIPIIVED